MTSMESEPQTEAPFGDWLLRKLREREMSLSDVARLAQCDYTYLWRLVNVGRARGRQYRRPSYAMAERVGRALGAPHEALAAAGYLPAEKVRNSRVVDALDRVERQLLRLREELAEEGAALLPGEKTEGAAADWRSLPLIEGPRWPADPDTAARRIDLPAWLAADARWVVRVGIEGTESELRAGDLALIRSGGGRPGQWVAVVREGTLAVVLSPAEGRIVGTVATLIRRVGSD